MSKHPTLRRLCAALATAGGLLISSATPAAERAFIIPPPAADQAASAAATATQEKAVIAGGCFWGGQAGTANYNAVGSGRTGHAEAVEITYDPRQISYGQLLQIYFSVAHDPTQLNRQGPDHGTQYRSAVFPANDSQRKVAEAYIAQLNKTGVYPKALATTIEPLQAFYPAEDYHQDYLVRNPNSLYIVINDVPKVENLAKTFPDWWRDKPVLVGAKH
ncbi:peptide-methionine (S)-S-oxide reductase MsrA [Achromobacter sp. GbtcB20]|uniref:peptide-methionine (S)-S-oxide reductase MsrA n=1 Tax=Achromobacter sp. GbtcB20 TaxID=2824765 RepID=UPI001C2F9A30|nr:peptide-methionine (S)-S-oxide reductase MsrA [Achromobacter sp. GbtcB20]